MAEKNPEITKAANFRLVRSSSSSMPPVVMERLEKTFNVPVIEAYGMTEAAHQMACNPMPPKKRKPGSVGPAAGPELAVMAENGEFLPPGKISEVVIRGENVMKGYQNNPQANEKAFTNGWFHTGDQGYLDEDGYLFLTGRLKELINRGGQKVSPREIDEVLLTHPSVSQAVAFAIPHQRLGEAVGAAVVLKQGAAISEQELRHFAAEQLVSYKVPQQIVFLDEIPKGATGKLQRIGLAEKLSHLLETGYIAPRDEGETQLAKIWSEVLGVERIGLHDNFFALGGDSLMGTQVVSRVVEKFQIDLPIQTLFRHPILEEFSKVVLQYQEQKEQTSDMDTLTDVLSQVENLSDEDAEALLKDNK
jgi:acyl carrier protein